MRSVALVIGVGLLFLSRPTLAQHAPPGHDTTSATARARISFEALKGLAGTWTGTVKTEPTNPDLDAEILSGTLRADLFYWLTVLPIEMRPLAAPLARVLVGGASRLGRV